MRPPGCRWRVPKVRALSPYVPGKPIEELERQYGVRHIIKLASSENPTRAREARTESGARRAMILPATRMANGFALKQRLAGHHRLTPAHITLGNGSNDILETRHPCLRGAGARVIFSRTMPSRVYPIVTQAVGARPVTTPARHWGSRSGCRMRAAITPRTRLVFIANDEQPDWHLAAPIRTGTLFGRICRRPCPAVLDEASFEYVREPDYPDGASWIGRFPGLLVTRTFSKAHGLAGLRVGYGLSSPAIADILNRVRQPFNVNSVALAAAVAALDDAGLP